MSDDKELIEIIRASSEINDKFFQMVTAIVKERDELQAKLIIAREALVDACEKISSEYCSHGMTRSPDGTKTPPECGDHDSCYAQEQHRALKKISAD